MSAKSQDDQRLLLYTTGADQQRSVEDLISQLNIQAGAHLNKQNPITIDHEIQIPDPIKNNTRIFSVDGPYLYFVNQSGRKINGTKYYIIQLSQPKKFIHFYNYFMNEYLPAHYANETLDLSGLRDSPLPNELKEERNPLNFNYYNFNYSPFCQTFSLVCFLFSKNDHPITQLVLIGNNMCNPQSKNQFPGIDNIMECLPLYFPNLHQLYLADNGISLDENNYQQTIEKLKNGKFNQSYYNQIEYRIIKDRILFISRETDLKPDFILNQIQGQNLNTLEILDFLKNNENNFPPEAYVIPEAYDLHHLK